MKISSNMIKDLTKNLFFIYLVNSEVCAFKRAVLPIHNPFPFNVHPIVIIKVV